MAYKVSLAPAAEGDLEQIFAYLAPENLDAAVRLLDRIQHSIERLAEHPRLGPPFSLSVRGDLHKITVRPYLVVYRIVSTKVQVIRILHASRDLSEPHLFEGPVDD